MKLTKLLLLGTLLIAKSAVSQTITLQPDGVMGKDAIIILRDAAGGSEGNTNYGTDASLKGSRTTASSNWYKTRGLLQYDLSGIPNNAHITSATLTLSGTNHVFASTNASTLSRVVGAWDEQTVTWNNQPAITLTSQIALAASTTSTQIYNIDVKTHVQDMVKNPAANFGWMLKVNGEGTAAAAEMFFASSDYTVNATLRPKLVITYLILNFAQTPSSTPSTSNGAVDLSVSGGTAPYTYSWVNAAGTAFATTQDISGLLPGYYAVTVTDNASKVATAYAVVGSKGTAATVTIQPNPALGNDAVVSGYDNGTYSYYNYATDARFTGWRWTNAGNWFRQRSMISYNLSSIPPYAIVTGATLYLYGTDHATTGQPNASTLQRVVSPWTEGYVSWETKPLASSTGEIPIAASTTSTQNYTIDVTKHVIDMVHAPETNFGWMLKLNGDGVDAYTRMVFASSDYTTDVTKRPKLVITFYIPDGEETRNWVGEQSFDNNGNVIEQSRKYIDAIGRTTQQQTLDIENSNVLATQNVFDAYGRTALNSLNAPIFQGGISYKTGFIKDPSGNEYSYDDFDLPITSLNLTGEVNNPAAVNNSTQGSLGWYYSNNNTAEAYVPASSFPYNRSEYYNDPSGRLKRVAQAGENLKMGSTNEQELFYMANAGELYYVYGNKGSAIVGLETGNIVNENLNAQKTIVVDADGNVTVSYKTLSGLGIAKCQSGVTTSCVAQSVSQNMVFYGLKNVKVHIPAAKKDKLMFPIPADGFGLNEHISTSNPQQIFYKIYDLRKEKLLVLNTDYTFDRTTREVDFIGDYLTGDGFFQISYEYSSTYISTNFGYSAGQRIPEFIPNLPVKYELDYSNWAINFFDRSGQLVKSVEPEAINCTYNPLNYNTIVTNGVQKPIVAAATNAYTHAETTTADVGYDKILNFHVLLGFIACSSEDGDEGIKTVSACSSTVTPTFVSTDAWMDNSQTGKTIADQLQNRGDNTNYGLRGPIATTGETEFPPLDPLDPVEPPWPTPYEPNGPWGSTRYYLNLDFELLGKVGATTTVLGSGYKIIDSPFSDRIWDFALTQNANDGINAYNQIGVRLGTVNIDVYAFDADHNTYYYDRTEAYNSGNSIHTNLICNFEIGVYTQLNKFPSTNAFEEVIDPLVKAKKYNSLGWLIQSVSGDEGTVNYVYDTEGKLRFQQNKEQQNNGGKFTYMSYDRAGRVIETGEYDPAISSTGTILVFQPYNADGTVPTAPGSGTSVHAIIDNLGWAYSNRSTQQTYNTYDFVQSDFPGSLSGYSQNYKDGQLVKLTNAGGKVWYGYNDLGVKIWDVQDITGLGIKTLEYTYTKEGLLEQTEYQRATSGERFLHKYLYDANNRLKETQTGFTPSFVKRQALKYYLHGALKRNELGETLQGLDYVYTINGWLKSMNDPTLTDRDPGKDSYSGVNSGFKKDVWGFTLDYFTGDYSRTNSYIETYTPPSGGGNTALPESHKGNIRAMRWQTTLPTTAPPPSVLGEVQYIYKYDEQSQLKEAIFGQIISSGVASVNGLTYPGISGATFFEYTNAYHLSNLTYDKNGNIKTLKREGDVLLPSMDDFTYIYDVSKKNRLLSITDLGTSINYADDIESQSPNNYEYNAIGQVTRDILSDYTYSYNQNGLVTNIKKNSGVNILSIEYSPIGLRQKKTTYNGSGVAQNYIYYVYDAAGMLLSTYTAPVSTGMAVQNDLQIYGSERLGTYSRSLGSYIYELKDHLGNVRSTIRMSGTAMDVLSYTDYYPHGSPMPGRNYVSSPAYRFAYQGQEKEAETGFLNFELRQYDPRIGRWFNPDPMGQYHSPYLAMGNNPISRIDPTGGEDGAPLPLVTVQEYQDGHSAADPLGLLSGPVGHFFTYNTNTSSGFKNDKWHDGGSLMTAEQAARFKAKMTELSLKDAKESMKNYYKETMQTASDLMGYAGFALELGGHASDIQAQQAFKYGQRIDGKIVSAADLTTDMAKTMTKVSQVAGVAGLIFGVGSDLVGVKIYKKDGYKAEGAVTPQKAFGKTAIGVWAVAFSNPASAIAATALLAIDAIDPGGWRGALNHNAERMIEHRAIIGEDLIHMDNAKGF